MPQRTSMASIGWGSYFNPRRSFAAKLALVITALLMVMLGAVTLITIRTVQSTLTDQIGENFQSQAESVSDAVSLFMLEKASELQVLASLESVEATVAARNASYQGSEPEILAGIVALDQRWVNAADSDPLIEQTVASDPASSPTGAQLTDFLAAFPAHSEVFITDRYGATIAATGRLSDYYQADEEWWQAGWNNGSGAVYISDPEFDESAGVTALLIAIPIFDDETNEVIGVLRSTLNVEALFDLVGAVTFGETGYAAVLNGEGAVIYDPRQSEDAPSSLQPVASARRSTDAGFTTASGTIFGYTSLAGTHANHEEDKPSRKGR